MKPAEPNKTEFWLGVAGAVALVIACFVFRREVGPALHHIEHMVGRAGPLGPLLFALTYAVWATLCLPGPIMLATAGTLFASKPLVAIACVSVGDTLAQGAAFGLARRWAHARVQGWLGEKSWFKWLQDQIANQGARAVFTVRLMPFFPNSLGNYAFGLTSVRFWPYLWASFAGSLPNTALYVGGTVGIVHLVRSGRWEHDLFLGLGITLAVVGVVLAIRRLTRPTLLLLILIVLVAAPVLADRQVEPAQSRFGIDYVFPMIPRYQQDIWSTQLAQTGAGWVNFAEVTWAYRAWIHSLVERYDGDGKDDMPGLRYGILHYQVGNEYANPMFWTGTRKDYETLLTETARTARAACPQVKIISNGIRWNDLFHNDPTGKLFEGRPGELTKRRERLLSASRTR